MKVNGAFSFEVGLRCSASLNVGAEVRFRARGLRMVVESLINCFLVTGCFQLALVFPDAKVAQTDQVFSNIHIFARALPAA